MDRDISDVAVAILSRCREDIASLVPIIKLASNESEYEELGIALATIVFDIESNVIDRIIEKNPGMREAYERKKAKIGFGM